MVKKGIVLSHIISSEDIEVDKAKVNFIANLPLLTCVKNVWSFLGHASFYQRLIKDFSKITKALSVLLAKETPFHFIEECEVAFIKLKEALTTPLIFHPPIWGESFELMCDASDYVVMVVLG